MAVHRFAAQLVQGFASTGDLPHDVPAFLRMHGRENLVQHVGRVASWGERIAQAAGADSRAAIAAGWLHDVSLVLPHDAMLDRVVFTSDKLSWDPADAPYYADLSAALERSLDDAVRCFLDGRGSGATACR